MGRFNQLVIIIEGLLRQIKIPLSFEITRLAKARRDSFAESDQFFSNIFFKHAVVN